MYGRVLSGIVLVFLSAVPNARAVSTYTCTTFTEGGGAFSSPGPTITGANDQLQIAGIYQNPSSSQNVSFFVDRNGQTLPLTLPPFAASDPRAQIGSVNNAGQVAGYATDNSLVPPRLRGFISNADGTYLVIDPPPDTSAQSFRDIYVSGINDHGDLSGVLASIDEAGNETDYSFIRDSAGFFTISNDSASPYDQHPMNNLQAVIVGSNVRLPDGSMTPLTLHGATNFPPPAFYGINDAGFVAGNIQSVYGDVAFVRGPDGNAPAVTCPERRFDMTAYAVNNNGVVAASVRPDQIAIATPTGFHSGLQLSNTSWTFSPSPAGQMGGSGTIYITSTGVADLEVESIVNESYPDFDLTQRTCFTSLAPGQFCSVSFTFKPSGVGFRTGQIVIYDNAPDAPHVIPLAGMGLGKGRLQFSNQSWNFGEQPIGSTTGPGIIYLYNPGTDAINFSSIAITGTNSPDFVISSNTCGAAIAPYTTCAVGFQFAPRAAGIRSAALNFSDDSGAGPQAIPLEGSGR
jgi:hypothetical protein